MTRGYATTMQVEETCLMRAVAPFRRELVTRVLVAHARSAKRPLAAQARSRYQLRAIRAAKRSLISTHTFAGSISRRLISGAYLCLLRRHFFSARRRRKSRARGDAYYDFAAILLRKAKPAAIF